MIYKLVPVLLLLALGVVLGRRRFLSTPALEDLKRLVVNVTLPAGLFLSFSRVALDVRLAVVPLLVFAACLAAYLIARRSLARTPAPLEPAPEGRRFFPFLIAGFEAGMLGYAVFGAVYGVENIYKFGLIDLGQVVFVFFVLAPALQRQSGGAAGWRATTAAFLRTPVILAILGGIVFNRSGLYAALASTEAYAAIETVLALLGGMTTPLVALIIGAQLAETRLSLARLAAPARLTAARLLLWAPAAALLAFGVLQALLRLDEVYQAAALALAVLPPPFVIPLYLRHASAEENAFVINTLSLATLVFIPAFILITLLFPPA